MKCPFKFCQNTGDYSLLAFIREKPEGDVEDIISLATGSNFSLFSVEGEV